MHKLIHQRKFVSAVVVTSGYKAMATGRMMESVQLKDAGWCYFCWNGSWRSSTMQLGFYVLAVVSQKGPEINKELKLREMLNFKYLECAVGMVGVENGEFEHCLCRQKTSKFEVFGTLFFAKTPKLSPVVVGVCPEKSLMWPKNISHLKLWTSATQTRCTLKKNWPKYSAHCRCRQRCTSTKLLPPPSWPHLRRTATCWGLYAGHDC